MYLVKNNISEYIDILEVNNLCESVFWLKINQKAFNFEMIIGAVYFLHEGSKYYSRDCFDNLGENLVDIKAKYNIPVLLIGDFNARTAKMNDFVTIEDGILNYTRLNDLDIELFITKELLDDLGILTERYNMDCNTNNNGYNFIDICRNFDLHIINGRFGADKDIGKFTCDNRSCIDYMSASPEILTNIQNFYVDIFDCLLSDKRNPICV